MNPETLDGLIDADPLAKSLLHGTKPLRDVAPFADLELVGDKVSEAIRSGKCEVISPQEPAYTAGNSLVYCGPDIHVNNLIFTGTDIRVATTIVAIYGKLGEELHHHTSHVISTVISGKGWLDVEGGRKSAGPGDLVVIPRGVKHLFNCEEGGQMLIFAIEISDQVIDHQKNFYSSD